MKISVAKSAGFCFGVKRALNIALEAASSGKVRMLGDIVHNEVVVGQLRSAGIRNIKKLGSGRGKTLLIRAHGAQRATLAAAKRAGYRIIDATCPMVKEIHAIAKELEDDGRKVIVIGDREHDEVRGIVGQLKNRPVIISSRRDIGKTVLAGINRAGIVAQSTQEEDKVLEMVGLVKAAIPDVAFKNTICNPTKTKQREAKSLPAGNDVVVIVGSRSSANTKRLYQISKRLNKRTHWVNSPKEVRREWFRGALSTGITAGASTPDSSIKAVADAVAKVSGERNKRR